MNVTGTAWFGDPVSLRWVLIHMIEDTVRHAGHMDILRELIDGRDWRPSSGLIRDLVNEQAEGVIRRVEVNTHIVLRLVVG